MTYLDRQIAATRQRMLEDQAQRRLDMIEQFSDFNDRQWLESMNYAELVAHKNAGHLSRPTLDLDTGQQVD